MLLEVPNELVADHEEHRQADHGVPERGILGHDRQDGPLNHVVNDVGGQRVLAERAEQADLDPADVAQRNEQCIKSQCEARGEEA